MIEYEIRTKKEIERDARNARIRSDYQKMKQEMPDVADLRIFKVLGTRYHLVWETIRTIILKTA